MRLKDYLKANGVKMSWVAEKTGFTASHISNVCTGKNKASKRFMIAIENLTKGSVKPEDFHFRED